MQCENQAVSRQSRWAAKAAESRLHPLLLYRFKLEFIHKPPPRKPSKASREVPGEGKMEKEEGLGVPPLGRDKKGKAAASSFPCPTQPSCRGKSPTQ